MSILFAFPGYELFTQKLCYHTGLTIGDCMISTFPDHETLVTINTDVKNKEVIVVCGLDDPNTKAMPLLFFTNLAREFGAKRICLVAPYLGYMRQDKRFEPGQAITSKIFALFLSSLIDQLITLDPHLHRYASLDELYTIPTITLHAAEKIGNWIKTTIKNPVLVGPDEESKQWVQAIARRTDSPFIVLKKIRYGAKEVKISVPDVGAYKNYTPVLVDDIIATARTMIKTVTHLFEAKMKPPVCIGIHALFVDDAYEALQNSGAAKIVTTNTIIHETNAIDVITLFSESLK